MKLLKFKKKQSPTQILEESVHEQLYPKGELQYLLFEPFIERYMSQEAHEYFENIPIYYMSYYIEDELQGKLF